MKIWVLSDLHLSAREMWSREPPISPPADADVAVISGDLTDGDPVGSIRWLSEHIRPHMPVVFVLGNHDFYDEDIDRAREAAAAAALEHGIDLLDDSAAIIDGVRFVGATLWTDYEIQSRGDPEWRRYHMNECARGLNDHFQIRRSGRLFRPSDAAALHEISRNYLDSALASPFDGETVVVTHHAPHPGSIESQWVGDELNAGFVSDLTDLIERHQPALWIHGHTHCRFDYAVGGTRVICNPRGPAVYQVLDFDQGFVVDTDDLVPTSATP